MTNASEEPGLQMRGARVGGPALLAVSLVLVTAVLLQRFSFAGDGDETKQFANAIEQRIEMIKLLKSIDGRLVELKAVLEQKK